MFRSILFLQRVLSKVKSEKLVQYVIKSVLREVIRVYIDNVTTGKTLMCSSMNWLL